ncbi:pyruvate, water dikinase regulatory protein [Pelosinus sp. sgz500959]|uniref:pyruvate, water dikinase regulatory protein n=1 Tax=Pelosinus sp. sgz500959 TaxID=3242472 RepID=UPI0036717EA5
MHTLSNSQVSLIYILSDSIGETGEMVAKAALSQFDEGNIRIRRKPYLKSAEQIELALKEAAQTKSAILYTLVRPDLKMVLETKAKALGLVHVDIMGPVVNALSSISDLSPRNEPGLIRKIDDAYFAKIEAIEFAVKFDDGKEPRGLLQADIVITGVSRASKTPLCMYLAHQGVKAANVPLVKEVAPPPELFLVPPHKVIGLMIKPSLLYEIRRERLKAMGLQPSTSYANMERIIEELEYGQGIMRKIGCPIIDVTNKATEETAAKVMEIYRKGVNN